MNQDKDICEHIHHYEFTRIELTADGAVDRLDCHKCGDSWTFEREPTIVESFELLNRQLRALWDEIVKTIPKLSK